MPVLCTHTPVHVPSPILGILISTASTRIVVRRLEYFTAFSSKLESAWATKFFTTRICRSPNTSRNDVLLTRSFYPFSGLRLKIVREVDRPPKRIDALWLLSKLAQFMVSLQVRHETEVLYQVNQYCPLRIVELSNFIFRSNQTFGSSERFD